jgi:hypothetical protein
MHSFALPDAQRRIDDSMRLQNGLSFLVCETVHH